MLENFGSGWFQHLDANNNFASESLFVYQKSGDCIDSQALFINLETGDIPGMSINSLVMRPRFKFDREVKLNQITILKRFELFRKDYVVF